MTYIILNRVSNCRRRLSGHSRQGDGAIVKGNITTELELILRSFFCSHALSLHVNRWLMTTRMSFSRALALSLFSVYPAQAYFSIHEATSRLKLLKTDATYKLTNRS